MDNGIRYEKFKDEKVRTLLKEKDALVKEGRELIEEHQKIEKELEKRNQKIQKIKDKVKPLIDPFVKDFNLGEFEVPTEVNVEGGGISVQIIDQVEAYKETIRKQKEDGLKANIDPSKESDKETA